MFRSKIKKNSTPAISTASLPDIVFILLFFFMVITNMRTTELKVVADVPRIDETTTLKNSQLNNQIYIGRPIRSLENEFGTEFKIQLGNRFGSIEDVGPYVKACKEKVPKDKKEMFSISLKIDADAPMELIDAVKLELRKANQLRVNYYAMPIKK